MSAGEDILAGGVPVLLGQEWYSSEYWLPPGSFSDEGGTERYYRFGFDVGFTVGLVLLGIPEGPSRAALGQAGESAASMTWSPTDGAPHRFVGRGLPAAFAGLVYASAETVADDEPAQEGHGQLLLVMPFHHGFVTAVVLADVCRSARGSEADVAVGH